MTTRRDNAPGNEYLIDEFIRLAEAHGTAILDGDVPKANRVFSQMKKLDDEFQARGLAARILLLPLLENRSEVVRYYAAIRLLAIDPARARAVIEHIASGVGPLAGDAGMGLLEIDSGRFKPE